MIKFFRHIRRSLIQENKMGKYFKYAIGEIVLVMIGILLALQINNWNQNRLNTDLESLYYKRLLDDVREEEQILEAIINYSNQVTFHAKRAIAVFENSSKAADNPVENIIDMYQASQFTDSYSAESTFKELIASGQINLLQNDSIKTALIRYYDAEWAESGTFTFKNKYRENLRGKMPDDIQTQIRMNCGDIYLKKGNSYLISLPDKCNIDLDINIAKSVIDELRTDESLKKDLRYLIGNEEGKMNDLKPIKKQLNNLISLLEEINNENQ
ncbi:MAG: hypothetical protein ED556_02055 [Winogradskyella sp.]|uniref:DUF6090 family protein n=1 Tax=Winogradskyella sp. TaxID=1883156 RepID=UPI000F3F7D19|nr:DUF6090 family protein [Winogradskyella sp.]RNC87996.1 MAG: hypothetical protein ED556_02055 [Winogradskyella sp.]